MKKNSRFAENNLFPEAFEAESFHENKLFEKATFSSSILEKVEFYKCSFSGCDFNKSKLIKCEFEKCTFESCDLSLINFGNSGLADVKFFKSKMIGILWDSVRKPSRYSFSECKLDNCSFYGLDLRSLEIINCSAREVDFTQADLSKANFSGTDLMNSRFSETNLCYADLSSAINYSIDPFFNKIKKASFSFPEVTTLLNYMDIIIK